MGKTLKRQRERERWRERRKQTLVEYIEKLPETRLRASSNYRAYVCLSRMRNYLERPELHFFPPRLKTSHYLSFPTIIFHIYKENIMSSMAHVSFEFFLVRQLGNADVLS